MHIKQMIEEYLQEWQECRECNMMIRPELIKYDVPDIICKDCYKETQV